MVVRDSELLFEAEVNMTQQIHQERIRRYWLNIARKRRKLILRFVNIHLPLFIKLLASEFNLLELFLNNN